MKKTVFGIILAFAIIIFGSSCFATNNENSMMDNAGQGMKNIANGAGNVIEDTAQGAGNVVQGIAGGIGEGINNMGNGLQNMTRGSLTSDANNENNSNNNNNNGNYTATRTATTTNNNGGTFLGMNAVGLGWLVMAVLGIAIVGLVWFYGKQHEDGYNPNHEDNY